MSTNQGTDSTQDACEFDQSADPVSDEQLQDFLGDRDGIYFCDATQFEIELHEAPYGCPLFFNPADLVNSFECCRGRCDIVALRLSKKPKDNALRISLGVGLSIEALEALRVGLSIGVPAFSQRNRRVMDNRTSSFYTVTNHVKLTFEQLERHFPDMEIKEDAKCKNVIHTDASPDSIISMDVPGHVKYNFDPLALNS
jgi:hypothetical protein